jgi:hypothetical protein
MFRIDPLRPKRTDRDRSCLETTGDALGQCDIGPRFAERHDIVGMSGEW